MILKLYSIKKTGKSIKSGAMKIEKILSRELGNLRWQIIRAQNT